MENSKKELRSLIPLCLVIIFYYLIFRKPFSLYGDNLIQNFPIFTEIARQIKNFNLPLWTPFIFGGQSLISNPQAGIFYPFYWISFLFNIPKEYMLDISTLIHIFIAFYSMKKFLRLLNFNEISSTYGSLFYVIGGISPIIFYGSINMFAPFAWLPLVCYYFLKILNSNFSIKDCLFFSISYSLLFYTGYAQYSVYTLIILLFIFLFHFKNKNVSNLFISIFITFILIFPYYLIIKHGMNITLRVVKIGINSSISFQEFLNPYMDRFFLYGLFFPLKRSLFLNIFHNSLPYYIGFLETFLLLYFIYHSYKNKKIEKKILPFILIFCWSLIAGINGFWQKILYHIPIYNLFRGAIKHVFELQFSLSIILAYSFEKKFSNKINLYWKVILLSYIVIFFCLRFSEIEKLSQKISFLPYKKIVSISPIKKSNFEISDMYRVFSIYNLNPKININLYPFNLPILKNLFSVNGYGPTLPKIFNKKLTMDYTGEIINLNKINYNILSLLNVKKIFVQKGLKVNFPEFIIKRNDFLYENKKNCGFIFFPKFINESINNSDICNNIKIDSKNKYNFIDSFPEITSFKYNIKKPDKFFIKINSNKKSFVVVSLINDDNWIVTVNNKIIKTYKANDFLLGFFIKKGENNININYLLK